MHQNIKNNNIKSIDAKLYSANYYDFMLYKGETVQQDLSDLKNMSIADFSNLHIVNGVLYSTVTWDKAINYGVEMSDIGFTGVDNGLISFNKDRITNAEFIELFTNSQYVIESGDTRFFLTPVTGNTQQYEYPLFLVSNDEEKYIARKGGFYQGFFKLFGHDYQVLPTELENEWVMHFKIRPRTDYVVTEDLVNHTHENNNGIFFFMGTRAENKFWPFYKVDESIITDTTIEQDSVISLENEWLLEEDCPFDDTCPNTNNKSISEEYIGDGVIIDNYKFYDSLERDIRLNGHNEIISDNKFLMFDRTPSGLTVDTWIEGSKVMLTNRRNWPNANYFLLMDRTPTGYTKDNIEQYNLSQEYKYDLYDDIKGNVFALRITKDGSIGYRYGVLDCDSNSKYKVIEEYSKPNLIKNDEWNAINVRFIHCGDKKMSIYIYIGGNLVFISKKVDSFNFSHFKKEVAEKQETVPYNISLGGGTLGLLETILPNYYSIRKHILPIEKDFCGTFMGDIKSFKMYEGQVNYTTIANYLS